MNYFELVEELKRRVGYLKYLGITETTLRVPEALQMPDPLQVPDSHKVPGPTSGPASGRKRASSSPDRLPWADKVAGGEEAPRSSQPASPAAASEGGTTTASSGVLDLDGLDLGSLGELVRTCSACPLHKGRANGVPGHGPGVGGGEGSAKVMIVTARPTHDDDLTGECFSDISPEGSTLTKMIEALSLKRESVYLTTLLKCMPPAGWPVKAHEAAVCKEYFDKEVELVRPEILIIFGDEAVRSILGRSGVGEVRGSILEFESMKVVATYGPRDFLREPALKRMCWDDLQLIVGELKGEA